MQEFPTNTPALNPTTTTSAPAPRIDVAGRDRLREVVANLTTVSHELNRLCWEANERGHAELRGRLRPRVAELDRCRDRLAGICVELAVSGVGGSATSSSSSRKMRRAICQTRARAVQDIALQLSRQLAALECASVRNPRLPGQLLARLDRASHGLALDVAGVQEVCRRAMRLKPS